MRIIGTPKGTLAKLVYSADGDYTPVTADSDGLKITLGTQIAGERNIDSAASSYLSVKEDWNYTVVDCSANSTTVSATAAILGNIWVTVALSAHTVLIKDDTVLLRTLPASAAINASYEFQSGTRCATSIVVDPDDSSTGTIVVQWRPL